MIPSPVACRGCRSARRRAARAARSRAPRDRDALLLPARQLAREMVCARGEPDRLQQLPGPARRACLAAAGRRQRHLDVLRGRQRRDQVELLEHEADRLEPNAAQLASPSRAMSRPSNSTSPDGGGRGPEQLQQRRLARPARPDEREELAAVDRQLHVADGHHLGGALPYVLATPSARTAGSGLSVMRCSCLSRCGGVRRRDAGGPRAGRRRRRRPGRRAPRGRRRARSGRGSTGASRPTVVEPLATAPCPKPPPAGPPERAAAAAAPRRSPGASGRPRRSRATPASPIATPSSAAEQALHERLARDLAAPRAAATSRSP